MGHLCHKGSHGVELRGLARGEDALRWCEAVFTQRVSPSLLPLPGIPSWRANRPPLARGLPLYPPAVTVSSVATSTTTTRSQLLQEPECECALSILDPIYFKATSSVTVLSLCRLDVMHSGHSVSDVTQNCPHNPGRALSHNMRLELHGSRSSENLPRPQLTRQTGDSRQQQLLSIQGGSNCGCLSCDVCFTDLPMLSSTWGGDKGVPTLARMRPVEYDCHTREICSFIVDLVSHGCVEVGILRKQLIKVDWLTVYPDQCMGPLELRVQRASTTRPWLLMASPKARISPGRGLRTVSVWSSQRRRHRRMWPLLTVPHNLALVVNAVALIGSQKPGGQEARWDCHIPTTPA